MRGMSKTTDSMRHHEILGYRFAVLVRKGESGYVAHCPGVGGVYEEGATREEAFEHACAAACAIFEARRAAGVVLTEDGPHLKVIRRPLHRAEYVAETFRPAALEGLCLLPA